MIDTGPRMLQRRLFYRGRRIMAEIKLTKNELRAQEHKLKQLKKYLPTLQLKKAMLQSEVNEARLLIEELENAYQTLLGQARQWAPLLRLDSPIEPDEATRIQKVEKVYENIAGVEVPHLKKVNFLPMHYSLFEAPPWVDGVVVGLRTLATKRVEISVVQERKAALEKELREVSIRVNLFEKVLIPRAEANIKKIKVFLGDQELAAVCQAKVAKNKIEKKKSEALCE